MCKSLWVSTIKTNLIYKGRCGIVHILSFSIPVSIFRLKLRQGTSQFAIIVKFDDVYDLKQSSHRRESSESPMKAHRGPFSYAVGIFIIKWLRNRTHMVEIRMLDTFVTR